jgi:hypothetical protein
VRIALAARTNLLTMGVDHHGRIVPGR